MKREFKYKDFLILNTVELVNILANICLIFCGFVYVVCYLETGSIWDVKWKFDIFFFVMLFICQFLPDKKDMKDLYYKQNNKTKEL